MWAINPKSTPPVLFLLGLDVSFINGNHIANYIPRMDRWVGACLPRASDVYCARVLYGLKTMRRQSSVLMSPFFSLRFIVNR